MSRLVAFVKMAKQTQQRARELDKSFSDQGPAHEPPLSQARDASSPLLVTGAGEAHDLLLGLQIAYTHQKVTALLFASCKRDPYKLPSDQPMEYWNSRELPEGRSTVRLPQEVDGDEEVSQTWRTLPPNE